MNARVSKGGSFSRRHIRTAGVVVTVLGMICLYRFILVPNITAHHPADIPVVPQHHASAQDWDRPVPEKDSGHALPGKRQARVASHQETMPRSASSTKPKPAAGNSPPVIRRRQQPPLRTAEKAPATHTNTAKASSLVAEVPPKAHLPKLDVSPEKLPAPGAPPQAQHHHHSKERVLDSDMEKASAVVDTLVFPKTERWRKRAPRVVVSKEASAHKNLRSKNYLEILPGQTATG